MREEAKLLTMKARGETTKPDHLKERARIAMAKAREDH